LQSRLLKPSQRFLGGVKGADSQERYALEASPMKYNELGEYQTLQCTLLRAARLSLMQAKMDDVTPSEEVQLMVGNLDVTRAVSVLGAR
jgi:hypothetical protein